MQITGKTSTKRMQISKSHRVFSSAIRSYTPPDSPFESLNIGKVMIKGWVESLPSQQRLDFGKTIVYFIVKEYWKKFYPEKDKRFSLQKIDSIFRKKKLNHTIL